MGQGYDAEMAIRGLIRRRWSTLATAVGLALLSILGYALRTVDHADNLQNLAKLIREIPTILKLWWFSPLLYILGILLILWVIKSDKRKRRAAASSIVFVDTEEVQVRRAADGGYERGASEERAVVVWFENKSKFDYPNVRAWLRYKTRDNKEDELEECDGFWLGGYRRSVDFNSKDKKALVIAIRDRNNKFSLLTNPNECDGANGLPRLIPLDDTINTHSIKVVLNVDGAPTKPFRCQLRLPPDFDVRCFFN